MQKFSFKILALLTGVLLGVGTLFVLLSSWPKEGVENGNRQANTKIESSVSTDQDSRSDAAQSESETVSLADTPIRIDELILPAEAFARKLTVVTWISTLTDEQILENLDYSTQATWNVSLHTRREVQSSLIKRLSLNSPNKALTFALARNEPQRTALISIVFQQWSHTDINEAIARAMEFPEEESTRLIHSILHARDDLSREQQKEIAKELGNQDYALTFYLQSLTKLTIENPKETWYEIVDLVEPGSSQQLAALRKVAAAWVSEKGLAALDEIRATITDDSNRDAVSFHVFLEHVKTHPEATFDYANSLSDIPASYLNTVVGRWTQQDYEAVIAKAETLSPSGVKDRMLSRAYQAWGEKDPIEFLERLNEIPAGHQERASGFAFRSLAQTNPTKAAEIILQHGNEQLQVTMAETLARQWAYHDSDAAIDWVFSLSDREPLNRNLRRTIAYSILPAQPRLAFQIAQELPETQTEGTSLSNEAQILHFIAGEDTQVAIELLTSVREQNQVQAYQVVANQLINLGDTQDVFTLGQQLSAEKKVAYFESVAIHWTRKDPQELLREFEKFPTATIKSKSALALITRNRLITAFSEDEINSLKEHLQPEDEATLNQTVLPEGSP